MQERDGCTISEDVLAGHMEDETVLLHIGTKRYYILNPTAACVWKGMERGADRAALVTELCEQFEVEPATAAAEVDRLLDELGARELIAAPRGAESVTE